MRVATRWIAAVAGLAWLLAAGCLGPAAPGVPAAPATQAAPAEKAAVEGPGEVLLSAPNGGWQVIAPQRPLSPGDLFVLRVRGAGVTGVRASGWQPAPAFFRKGNEWLAFGAVPLEAAPGPRPVQIQADLEGAATGGASNDRSRTIQTKTVTLTVAAKPFASSNLQVSGEQAGMLADARVTADARKVSAARSKSAPQPLWDGPFILPTNGEVTTQFGERRSVNGGPAEPHNGTDIANREGTPVNAANAGRVVLAEKLYLTGYTVIIDHGWNLFSSYSHLSALDVQAGQTVAKGARVGRMGSTGFSTGSHLHWVVSVGSEPVDPQPLLKQMPPE